MTPAEIAALVGRTGEAADVADRHRSQAYRAMLGLAPEDPALAVHWLLFSAIPPETRADGHAAVMPPFPPLPWPRRMWAGGEICWRSLPQPGEALHRTTAVSRAELKQGASGPFLLAALEHRIRGNLGASIDERQDIVFLPATARPGASTRLHALEPEWEEPAQFEAVDLFRYSALTLNSHRIHYDADYARDAEHYPGIVVHGPLLATRLMHAAARRSVGGQPARFAYRAAAPAFAGEPLRLLGRGSELAVAGSDGSLRMSATITFA